MAIAPKEISPGKFYSVDETARILEICSETVRKHLREDKIKGRKIGRRWLVKGQEIRKFIGE
jgi:excisionase family DNA binding protein